jgi:hypothetical protein
MAEHLSGSGPYPFQEAGMTRDELLVKLKECEEDGDPEGAHVDADNALIKYLADADIETIYRAITKWYA